MGLEILNNIYAMAVNLQITPPKLRYAAQDIPAGIVVFLVALPLCLGIALASGAPLMSGAIAGIVGGLVVSLFSGSELSVSGPAAGLATVVATAIATLGDFSTLLTAVVLAGLIQLLIALVKAGRLGEFIPHSVIKGMLAAIGISIILKQIPHAIGYDKDFLDEAGIDSILQWHSLLADPQRAFSSGILSEGAFVITGLCLVIMMIWEHPRIKAQSWSTIISGSLVAVLVGTSVNIVCTYLAPTLALSGATHMVNLPLLDVSQGFSHLFVTPNLAAVARLDVWLTAITIAVIASIESILSVEAVDKMDPYKRISNTNRELYAQGLGNAISGMLGGLPVTSVIVRSSANVYAGARTRTSVLVHGFMLAIAVFLIPGVLNHIPLACLASILLIVGYKLASVSLIKSVWKEGISQFVPFSATLVMIVMKDILFGVGIGLVVSTFFVMKSYHRKSITCVSDGNDFLVRFNKDITFVHKGLLKDVLREIPDNSKLILDVNNAHYIDHDIKELLNSFFESAESRNIEINVTGANSTLGVL